MLLYSSSRCRGGFGTGGRRSSVKRGTAGAGGQSAGGQRGGRSTPPPPPATAPAVGDEPPRQQAHGTALHTAQVRTGRRLRDPAQAFGVPQEHLQGRQRSHRKQRLHRPAAPSASRAPRRTQYAVQG